MDSKISFEQLSNEVMRKIGRNMLLFQQLEGLLKYIVSSNGAYSGQPGTLKSKRDKHVAEIEGSTMGQLVGQYLDSTYTLTNSDEQDANTDQFQIKLGVSIDCDEEFYLTKKATLSEIVSERNALIHHLLPKYSLSSQESLEKLEQELERQRDKLLPELEELQSFAEWILKSRKLLADYLQSEAGIKHFVEGVLPGESRLEALLAKLAPLNARSDGWSSLALVGRALRVQYPEKYEKALVELGISKIKSLKSFIEKSERFELLEEATRKGSQWLYRSTEATREVEVRHP